ncbi:MAG: PAS domain S-box protein [Phycisphaeraceae bacterium]|nr:PAS domain S-box protein [Phycisphaeraceae bacterium]
MGDHPSPAPVKKSRLWRFGICGLLALVVLALVQGQDYHNRWLAFENELVRRGQYLRMAFEALEGAALDGLVEQGAMEGGQPAEARLLEDLKRHFAVDFAFLDAGREGDDSLAGSADGRDAWEKGSSARQEELGTTNSRDDHHHGPWTRRLATRADAEQLLTDLQRPGPIAFEPLGLTKDGQQWIARATFSPCREESPGARDGAAAGAALIVAWWDVTEEVHALHRSWGHDSIWGGVLALLAAGGAGCLWAGAEAKLCGRITAQTQALSASRHMLRLVLNTVPQAVFWKDRQGRYLGCNKAFAAFSGLQDPKLVVGKTDAEMPWRLEDSRYYRQCDQQVIAENQPLLGIVQPFQSTDGKLHWAHASKVPLLDESGQVTGVLGTAEDITERMLAEQTLRDSEAKLRTITDAALDAVIMMDPQGKVAFWSPAAERIFGYTRQEIMGVNLHRVLAAPRHRPQALKHLPGFWETGKGEVVGRIIQVHGVRKDGGEFPAELSLSSVNLNGQWWAVAMLRDITERQQGEEALQQAKLAAENASRAKSEFLANMSHEIRTPMTAILGFAELLQDGAMSQEERLDHLATIRRNGEHLLSLINDILDLSKIEAGKMQVELISCDPLQVIEGVVALMRARATQKKLDLRVRYQGPLPATMQSDPVRLRQILLNLVGNAVKFTAEGYVELVVGYEESEAHEGRLRVEVHDTGPGIEAGTFRELFEPFTQADSSTSRQFGGTGLGLTISKRLAGILQGDIQVRSTVGKGSCFTLRVPTGPVAKPQLRRTPAELDRPAAEAGPRPEWEQSLSGRVMLAEDGPDNQRLIAYLLRKAGLEVEVAEHGQRAYEQTLEAWRRGQPFDVVLMDMQMPVMDGYEAVAKLREAGYRGVIVALTAHAMEGDREKCLQAGCDDYATKPIDRRRLLETVHRHIKTGWVSNRQAAAGWDSPA